MCLLNGRKYTVALMREGERHFRISSDIGENAPIPWTASGRLLLGHLSDPQILGVAQVGDEAGMGEGDGLDLGDSGRGEALDQPKLLLGRPAGRHP
eukprot:gene52582-64264_t